VQVRLVEVTTTGTGFTVTTTDWLAGVVPLAPFAVTVKVNVPVAVGVTVTDPLHVTVPERFPVVGVTVAVQPPVAFADPIAKVKDWPIVIVGVVVVMVTVG
jgi:hypothetical protein